jgi:chromate transporter
MMSSEKHQSRLEASHMTEKTGMTADAQTSVRGDGSSWEIFRVFLKLGLTSFGGPIAHLGYFRNEVVVRRRWIDEAGYADLVALSQFLPGPASSKVGFTLGLLRGGGIMGGLAAWLGFTMPSAIILFAFALSAAAFSGPVAEGLIHGLKLVAVAVVAQAIWGMARSLTPDRERIAIALGAVVLTVLAVGSLGQVGAIVLGALAGLWLCRSPTAPVTGHLNSPVTKRAGAIALIVFAVLLVATPILAQATNIQAIAVFDAFYRSGALVFGGGHVLLPLLQAEVVAPGWVTNQDFLAGYGVTQAMPGPLFTFAAYLGAVISAGPTALAGAAVALVAVFLPGGLLAYGILPFWDMVRARPRAQAAMRGANAGVVGILGAAFYNPVWTSAVLAPRDFALALIGFAMLTAWKLPPWTVVVFLAISSAVLGVLQTP